MSVNFLKMDTKVENIQLLKGATFKHMKILKLTEDNVATCPEMTGWKGECIFHGDWGHETITNEPNATNSYFLIERVASEEGTLTIIGLVLSDEDTARFGDTQMEGEYTWKLYAPDGEAFRPIRGYYSFVDEVFTDESV